MAWNKNPLWKRAWGGSTSQSLSCLVLLFSPQDLSSGFSQPDGLVTQASMGGTQASYTQGGMGGFSRADGGAGGYTQAMASGMVSSQALGMGLGGLGASQMMMGGAGGFTTDFSQGGGGGGGLMDDYMLMGAGLGGAGGGTQSQYDSMLLSQVGDGGGYGAMDHLGGGYGPAGGFVDPSTGEGFGEMGTQGRPPGQARLFGADWDGGDR